MADFDRINAALAAAHEALAAYRDYAEAAASTSADGTGQRRHREPPADFDPAEAAERIRGLSR